MDYVHVRVCIVYERMCVAMNHSICDIVSIYLSIFTFYLLNNNWTEKNKKKSKKWRKKNWERRDFQFTYPVIFIDWNSIKMYFVCGFFYCYTSVSGVRGSDRWFWSKFKPFSIKYFSSSSSISIIIWTTTTRKSREFRKLIPWTVWISSSNKCYLYWRKIGIKNTSNGFIVHIQINI